MNQRDLLAESEDVMKQNEAKPIRMDYPLGKNTQMAIYSLRHVCMRQTNSELIVLLLYREQCQRQTANDQWGKGMQTAYIDDQLPRYSCMSVCV